MSPIQSQNTSARSPSIMRKKLLRDIINGKQPSPIFVTSEISGNYACECGLWLSMPSAMSRIFGLISTHNFHATHRLIDLIIARKWFFIEPMKPYDVDFHLISLPCHSVRRRFHWIRVISLLLLTYKNISHKKCVVYRCTQCNWFPSSALSADIQTKGTEYVLRRTITRVASYKNHSPCHKSDTFFLQLGWLRNKIRAHCVRVKFIVFSSWNFLEWSGWKHVVHVTRDKPGFKTIDGRGRGWDRWK